MIIVCIPEGVALSALEFHNVGKVPREVRVLRPDNEGDAMLVLKWIIVPDGFMSWDAVPGNEVIG